MGPVPLGGSSDGDLLCWLGRLPGQGSCRGLQSAWEDCAQAGLLPSKIGTCTRGCHITAFLSPRCAPAGVCRSRVLKPGLQLTGKGLGLVAWRHREGPGVWSRLWLRVCTGRSTSLTEELHYQHTKGQAWVYRRSLIISMLTVGHGSSDARLRERTCTRADIWANCQHSHHGAWLWQALRTQALWVYTCHKARVMPKPIIGTPAPKMGLGSATSSSRFCGHARWVTDGITESHVLADSSWGGTCSVSFPRRSAPVPTTSHCSLELDPRASTSTTGSRYCPQQGCDNHRAKRGPCSTCSAGSGHHNTDHNPYQGDNGQCTLRKDTAVIHTKYSPQTKDSGLTQATEGCSHIKTVLQDHIR